MAMGFLFLFLHKNIWCGYSLEAFQQGASTEYLHGFWWRNKKNISTFQLRKKCLIWRYVLPIRMSILGNSNEYSQYMLCWSNKKMNILTLLLLNTTCPVLANSVDPDHLASEEAN